MKGRAIILATLMGIGIGWPVAGAEQTGSPGDQHPAANLAGAPRMNDIHDIKPLSPPGLGPWLRYYLPATLLAGVLAALIVYHRRNKAAPAADTRAPDPPDVIALRALDELAHRNDLEARRFYFRLSAILRGYMAQRFKIDAPEMTTEELLPAIGRLEIERRLQHQLKQLLRYAEPIKFAGQPAAKNRMHSDLAFGREFVKKTKPAGQNQDV